MVDDFGKIILPFNTHTNAETGKAIPVSYTHLDVYKRQQREMEEFFNQFNFD